MKRGPVVRRQWRIGSRKLISTSSHLQSELELIRHHFFLNSGSCPHTLQSKGKSKDSPPSYSRLILALLSTCWCPQKPAGLYSPVFWSSWVTFPGQLCPTAYTRQERPKMWQRHQRMKGLKKCQSGKHHKSMFKQEYQKCRWKRTHCIPLKEELQLAWIG